MRTPAFLLSCFALVACGGAGGEPAATTGGSTTSATTTSTTTTTTTPIEQAPPDVTAPTVTAKPGRYDVVRGSQAIGVDASDDVGVTRVELSVDGTKVGESTEAPFAVAWDSTAAEDGIRALRFVAYDAAGNHAESAEVPVIVVNQGLTPVYDESKQAVDGSIAGAVKVPADWSGNEELIDKKFHFAVPAGMTRLVGVLAWDAESGFEIEFSTGTGFCPDSGVSKKKVVAKDGEALLELEAPKGLDEAGWFIHVGAKNAADKLGKSVKFAARVAILP